VQVITTDQKKVFFRSDHEAMKMLREKKMSGWNSKTKKLYCRPLCLPVYEDIFINKIDKKREKNSMASNNF